MLCRMGEAGCQMIAVKTQAETMKAPSSAASITYSGQCAFSASFMVRFFMPRLSPLTLGAIDQPSQRSPEQVLRRLLREKRWAREPLETGRYPSKTEGPDSNPRPRAASSRTEVTCLGKWFARATRL